MLILSSLDTSISMKMALAFSYLVQSKDKLIIAFLMMEHVSSFPGLEMMMAGRKRAVVGFNFNLHG